MKCPHCGTSIPEGKNFCPACGKSTVSVSTTIAEYEMEEKACKNCGRVIKDNSQFCGGCGAALSFRLPRQYPRCIVCGKPLKSSVCEGCSTKYTESSDGTLELMEAHCPECNQVITEELDFCPKCGSKLPNQLPYVTKRLSPCCKNCGQVVDANEPFCASCGQVWGKAVKPRVINNRLTCPVCGEDNMPPTRTACFKCGTTFIPTKWTCSCCGEENLYPTSRCISCMAAPGESSSSDYRSNVPVVRRTPSLSGSTYRASTPTFEMKWFHFIIYFWIFCIGISNIFTGLVSMADTPFVGLLSICFGILAFVVRSQLANFKQSGPACYLALRWSIVLVGFFSSLSTIDEMSPAMEILGVISDTDITGGMYFGVFLSLAIQALILWLEELYFKKRKDLFCN